MRFIGFEAAIKFAASTSNTSIGYNNEGLQLFAPLMEKKLALMYLNQSMDLIFGARADIISARKFKYHSKLCSIGLLH